MDPAVLSEKQNGYGLLLALCGGAGSGLSSSMVESEAENQPRAEESLSPVRCESYL